MLLHCDRTLVNGSWESCTIRVKEGLIEKLGHLVPELGEEEINLHGLTLLPGLIDSHIHGCAGADCMDATPEALQTMSVELLKAGVTAFVPTTMTALPQDLLPALKNIGNMVGKTGGARILGAFAEGPFITAEHRGAQPLEAIAEPSEELLEQMLSAAGGTLKKVIIAPEAEGAAHFCRSVCEKGVIPAIGHSSATCDQTNACIEAGASIAVHCYNAMRGLHHREPGLLGAVMASERIYAELILDCIHVHPTAAKLLLRAKGADKVVLISDCMRAGGMADGEYMLGDTKCFVKDGIARTAEGNLAGSTLKLMDALKNAVEKLELPLETAVMLASENPAKALGLFDTLGSIAKGKAADLIAIDENYDMKFVMVGGEIFDPN